MLRMVLGTLVTVALVASTAAPAQADPSKAPAAAAQTLELEGFLQQLLARLEKLLLDRTDRAGKCETGHQIDPDGCPAKAQANAADKTGHQIDPDGAR